MTVLYIADDGKQFDNECDCLHYEFVSTHPCDGVEVYEGDKRLGHPIENDSYQNSDKVIIKDEDNYRQFIEVAKYCGDVEWEYYIEGPGEWVRDDKKCTWKKVK